MNYEEEGRCPTCGSPSPKEHPAIAHEGEVAFICPDRFHTTQSQPAKTDGNSLVRWGDTQQYISEPMPEEAKKGIQVHLLNAMPDPLGSLAAISGIYTGKVYRSLHEVTDEARRAAIDEMLATVLNGPLEVGYFHFLIEGVDRAITHQMVRNRFSFFAQESLRFAVKQNWAKEIPPPPFLSGTKGGEVLGAESSRAEWQRNVWDQCLDNIEQSYLHLVHSGMPAEEARALLPHAVTTRLHWVCDLRTLLTEAGKRTCTQAQFPWRMIFGGIAKVLREHGREERGAKRDMVWTQPDAWQFAAIADLIRPVCYQQGKCGFMAKFDRDCSIRDRVDANAKAGRSSELWGQDAYVSLGIRAIHDWEWAADPGAARKTVADA